VRLAIRLETAGARDQLRVVEHSRGRSLEHARKDDDAEPVRNGRDACGEITIEGLGEVVGEVALSGVAAERELREAHDLRTRGRGSSREVVVLRKIPFGVPDAASDLSRGDTDVNHRCPPLRRR
jgi:hypothetical protein